MKHLFVKPVLLGACGIVALAACFEPAQAQQQNIMQVCGAEWQAAKEGGKLPAGATWTDFLSQCRTRHAAQTQTAPAQTAPASDNTSVMRACGAEWQAAKEGGKLPAGATWNDFLAQCRVRHASPAAAPTTAPATTTQARPTTTAPAPAVKATTGYNTEREAQTTCPSDMVVWVNEKSDVYHFKGARYYGATKSGGYMCEREALRQGNHAAKDEKRPQQ